MTQENASAPAPSAGQATAPSSPAPASSAPAAAPADTGTNSDSGNDGFDFIDRTSGVAAPDSANGQGKGPDQAPDQGQPQPPAQAVPADPSVKSFLKDEFGGDVAKLDKAYGELRPKLGQLGQMNGKLQNDVKSLSTALNESIELLGMLEQVAGGEIEEILAKKGFAIQGSRLVQTQPGQAGQPAPQGQPAQRPLTERDVLRVLEERERKNADFDQRMNGFKAQFKDWEAHKQTFAEIFDAHPQLADAFASGQLPMELLYHMARGRTFDQAVKKVREDALSEGLKGHQARANATLETPGGGAVAGGDDSWGFIK